jgi:hypothetical protein
MEAPAEYADTTAFNKQRAIPRNFLHVHVKSSVSTRRALRRGFAIAAKLPCAYRPPPVET